MKLFSILVSLIAALTAVTALDVALDIQTFELIPGCENGSECSALGDISDVAARALQGPSSAPPESVTSRTFISIYRGITSTVYSVATLAAASTSPCPEEFGSAGSTGSASSDALSSQTSLPAILSTEISSAQSIITSFNYMTSTSIVAISDLISSTNTVISTGTPGYIVSGTEILSVASATTTSTQSLMVPGITATSFIDAVASSNVSLQPFANAIITVPVVPVPATNTGFSFSTTRSTITIGLTSTHTCTLSIMLNPNYTPPASNPTAMSTSSICFPSTVYITVTGRPAPTPLMLSLSSFDAVSATVPSSPCASNTSVATSPMYGKPPGSNASSTPSTSPFLTPHGSDSGSDASTFHHHSLASLVVGIIGALLLFAV